MPSKYVVLTRLRSVVTVSPCYDDLGSLITLLRKCFYVWELSPRLVVGFISVQAVSRPVPNFRCRMLGLFSFTYFSTYIIDLFRLHGYGLYRPRQITIAVHPHITVCEIQHQYQRNSLRCKRTVLSRASSDFTACTAVAEYSDIMGSTIGVWFGQGHRFLLRHRVFKAIGC